MTALADAIGSSVPSSNARPNTSAATVVNPFHPMRAVAKLDGHELRRVRDLGRGIIRASFPLDTEEGGPGCAPLIADPSLSPTLALSPLRGARGPEVEGGSRGC